MQQKLIELHANLQRMRQYPLPAPITDTINATFGVLTEMAAEIEALKGTKSEERRAA